MVRTIWRIYGLIQCVSGASTTFFLLFELTSGRIPEPIMQDYSFEFILLFIFTILATISGFYIFKSSSVND